jgi:hypothetical protein
VYCPVVAVEVWVRNPDQCIRECVEEQMETIVWDRGMLVKRSLDPLAMADLYYPITANPRLMVIGTSDQGAIELHRGDTMANPSLTYPVWEYGDELAFLEDMMEHEKRIVITQTPSTKIPLGRQFFRYLRDLQEENPDCTLHIHGLYSWRVMFGMGFKSVDVEPRMVASKGRVILPPGRDVPFERAAEMPHWVTLLGMHTGDLRVPRNRCMYNIRSARWAAKYFMTDVKFRTQKQVEIRPEAYTNIDWTPPTGHRILTKNLVPADGDKFLCNTCSLQTSCLYFRAGSVCSVPDSEPAELARFFKTRDSDTIIEGLGTLLAANTRRLEKGVDDEEMTGKLDPEVTKIFKHIFDQGVKLAKLVNPALARAGAPNVNFRFQQQIVTASSPQQLMAAAVAELEARGIHRDRITPEMIEELLGDAPSMQQRAIDVAHREVI